MTTNMASLAGSIIIMCVASIVVVMATGARNVQYSGGAMSASFLGASNNHTYRFHITVITGWVLGHGPCGPACSVSDVGKPTHASRLQVIQATGNPAIFGNWTKEVERDSGTIVRQTITDSVNRDIQGYVLAVNPSVRWEQEIAQVDVDIDRNARYTDISIDGESWGPFDLNRQHTTHGTDAAQSMRPFHLQTKINPKVRNDTGQPNNNPRALVQPVHRVVLNKVTEIALTSLDQDGDLVKCRLGRNVETWHVGEMPNTTVTRGCVVRVSAMARDGFREGSRGVVVVALEDFNRHAIDIEGHLHEPLSRYPLSSSVLQFMVWVVANMTVPEFVSPTPVSQHVYTVYAGSRLYIPLAARPSDKSVPSTRVDSFRVVCVPDHNLTVSTPHIHTNISGQAAVTSQLEFMTSETDEGVYLIHVVAIDSNGEESLGRVYKLHVRRFDQQMPSRIAAGPFFPFFPSPGSIWCSVGETCCVPVYAKPASPSHVVTSIEVNDVRTDLSDVTTDTVQREKKQGVEVFRSDVHLTSNMAGTHSICLVARDDRNLTTEECFDVEVLLGATVCETDEPCHSGAACRAVDSTSFTCLCPHGYRGPLCDQWMDPCLSSPCQQGGTCKSRRGYPIFVCLCPPGFTGQTCATNIDDCASAPCEKGGECQDGIQSFSCVCHPGFSGIHCQTELPVLFWAHDSLTDGAALRACPGDNVTLGWKMKVSSDAVWQSDTRWLYLGQSEEVIAVMDQGHLLVLPSFAGRVTFLDNVGLVLSHMTPGDAGKYSVQVGGQGGQGQGLHSTVTLTVDEPAIVASGQLRAGLQSQPVVHASSGQWAAQLRCGTFLFLGQPPVEIIWQTPRGRTVASSGYTNGQFSLLLPLPITGGTYTCFPRSANVTAGSLGSACTPGSATVTVDEMTTTLKVLQAEHGHLKHPHLRAK